MATIDSPLVVSREGDIIRIEFRERHILDEGSIQQIGNEIGGLIDAEVNPKVLISFDKVQHLSSSALGTLINLNSKTHSQGGQLRLSNIDPQIYEVFTMTRLDKLFRIFDDAVQAAASFDPS